MNYFEGLRRLTAIISVITAISTTAFLVVVDNSPRQEYSRLTNTIKKIKSQKELLAVKNNDYVKNYVDVLKKDAFEDLKILGVKDPDQNKEYMLLWQQIGFPQEYEIDLLIKNKLYLEGADYEKESGKMLLGYLVDLNDLSAIESKLTKTTFRMYFVPILCGAGSFFMVWFIFYCIRYVVLGFKKEKTC